MPKAFLMQVIKDSDPKKPNRYDFDSRPEKVVRHWTTLDSAKNACSELNRGVRVELSDGTTWMCTDFQAEQQPSGLFYLFCEPPFSPVPDIKG
jgi:hypothetical protein